MAELKWLEDLLALLDEGSFTRAAERRHVTQPAFSRRIRLLENWLGIAIVDRRRKPVGVLASFRQHEAEVRELVNRFYQLRNNAQSHTTGEKRLNFVVQHTLAISCFPCLISQIKQRLPNALYRIHTTNNENCQTLFQNNVDFMLRYDLPAVEKERALDNTTQTLLGEDALIPVAGGKLINRFVDLDQQAQQVLPLLLFPQGGFFANVLEKDVLPDVLRKHRVEIICESAFSVSLKQMVLSGMGIAWLPLGLVQQELEQQQLESLENQLGICPLHVVLYSRHSSDVEAISQLIGSTEIVRNLRA